MRASRPRTGRASGLPVARVSGLPTVRRLLVLRWLVMKSVSPNRLAAVLMMARQLAGEASMTRRLVANWLARAAAR
ncbi:hypothetical protein DMP23_39910 [Amycolatopsis sp. A1MSW2902]